jgi:hypothetical protein
VLGRVLIHRQLNPFFAAHQRHVVVPGGDPYCSSLKLDSCSSLLHRDLRASVQMLGEHAGEKRRHMLHDNYGNREIGRQGRNHFTKCVRSTGRGTDRDDIDAPLNGSDVLQTFEGFDQFAVKFFPILASRRDAANIWRIPSPQVSNALLISGVSASVPSRNLLSRLSPA